MNGLETGKKFEIHSNHCENNASVYEKLRDTEPCLADHGSWDTGSLYEGAHPRRGIMFK